MLLIGITFTAVGIYTPRIKETELEKPFENEPCNCNSQRINGLFQPPLSKIDIEHIPDQSAIIEYTGDLPDYFNWKDHEGKDWTTPVRDQGMCGSCSIFGCMSALESVINIQEGNPDLNLRIYIEGGGCSGFQYGFSFDDKQSDGDVRVVTNGVGLLVDPMSMQYLMGAV